MPIKLEDKNAVFEAIETLQKQADFEVWQARSLSKDLVLFQMTIDGLQYGNIAPTLEEAVELTIANYQESLARMAVNQPITDLSDLTAHPASE